LHKQYPRKRESELIEVLECEEFYRILRDKHMSEQDRMAIQEFVSEALTTSEWDDFQKHCSDNRLNPYEEMRELIYSSYAKMLRNNVTTKRKALAKRQKDGYLNA
jgi:hypothetical protein